MNSDLIHSLTPHCGHVVPSPHHSPTIFPSNGVCGVKVRQFGSHATSQSMAARGCIHARPSITLHHLGAQSPPSSGIELLVSRPFLVNMSAAPPAVCRRCDHDNHHTAWRTSSGWASTASTYGWVEFGWGCVQTSTFLYTLTYRYRVYTTIHFALLRIIF